MAPVLIVLATLVPCMIVVIAVVRVVIVTFSGPDHAARHEHAAGDEHDQSKQVPTQCNASFACHGFTSQRSYELTLRRRVLSTAMSIPGSISGSMPGLELG